MENGTATGSFVGVWCVRNRVYGIISVQGKMEKTMCVDGRLMGVDEKGDGLATNDFCGYFFLSGRRWRMGFVRVSMMVSLCVLPLCRVLLERNQREEVAHG